MTEAEAIAHAGNTVASPLWVLVVLAAVYLFAKGINSL